MSEYKSIPVTEAMRIADQFDRDIVVIVCWSHEHELLHTTTYGKSPRDKIGAAKAGELFAKASGMDLSRSRFYEDFRKEKSAAKQAKLKELCLRAKNALASLKAQCDEREWKEDWQNLPEVLKALEAEV